LEIIIFKKLEGILDRFFRSPCNLCDQFYFHLDLAEVSQAAIPQENDPLTLLSTKEMFSISLPLKTEGLFLFSSNRLICQVSEPLSCLGSEGKPYTRLLCAQLADI
jgi:hypothetical protein